MIKLVAFLFVFAYIANANFVREFEKLRFATDADDSKKIWVLLVAGSNGYYNYRHQVKFFN